MTDKLKYKELVSLLQDVGVFQFDADWSRQIAALVKEHKKRKSAPAVEAAEIEVPTLDERMKSAGMLSVSEMLSGQPLDAFIRHSGVNDIESFGKWLEMRRVECIKLQAGLTVGGREKDELYEWAIAHQAVFSEVHINFKAAIAGVNQQAGSGVPEGFVLVPIKPTEAMISAGNDAAHAGGCDLYQLKREVINAWPAMLAAAPLPPSPAAKAVPNE